MSQRKVLKEIIRFGKREFNDKKPLTLEIRRVKSKTVLTAGVLPSLMIKQRKGVKYLVIADYKDFFRIYSFTSTGVLLDGENLEKEKKLLKALKKGTVKEYFLPKEMPKLTIGDISTYFQKQFNKAQQHLNIQFGLSIKYPQSIVAVQGLKEVNERALCVQKDINLLKVDIKYYKTPLFDVIAYRELITYFLSNLEIFPENRKLLHDLSYFITAILLRGGRAEQIFELWENFSPIWEIDNSELNLIENKNHVLKLINKTYTERKLKRYLKNVFSTILLLDKYKILINFEEFLLLFKLFYQGFQEIHISDFLVLRFNHQHIIKILQNFYFEIFFNKYISRKELKSLSEIKEEPDNFRNFLKFIHLIIIFSIMIKKEHFIHDLNSRYPVLLEVESIKAFFDFIKCELSPMIRYFQTKLNSKDFQNDINNFELLLHDMVKSYLFDYCVAIKLDSSNTYSATYHCNLNKNKNIVFNFDVINHTDINFRDISFNFILNPKERVNLKVLKDSNHEVLDKQLEWKYEVTGNKRGNVSFSIQLVIQDPFVENKLLTYKRRLGVITVLDN